MFRSLPLVPAKAGTQIKNLDSRLRGNERARCAAVRIDLKYVLQE